MSFWLLYEEDLPKNSFIFNQQPYNVPCCFQIWIKKNSPREKKIFEIKNEIFDFVKKDDKADIAVRRVGGTTGKCKSNIEEASVTTHYFLKLKNKLISKEKLIDTINNLDVRQVCNNTAGVRSLSKPEFVQILFRQLNKENMK